MSGYTPYTGRLETQFNEQVVTEKTHIINLKSTYGISNLRDFIVLTGSANVTNNNAEYKLTTTSDGTDRAILESTERGRYYASQDSLISIGVKILENPVETQEIRWGYFDDNNGYGFGKDSTGLFIFSRRSTVESKTYQKDWNIDVVDGKGNSQVKLKETEGIIYGLNFSWYGSTEFKVVTYDKTRRSQRVTEVHVIEPDNTLQSTNPDLPIRVELSNNGTTIPFNSLYVGGREFSTYGHLPPQRRITSERRLELSGIGTTEVPMVSFRRSQDNATIPVKVHGVEVLADFDGIVEVRYGTNLTGAVFQTPTNHSATETAVESDISATAVTNGEIVYATFVTATGTGQLAHSKNLIPLLEQDFERLTPVTVTIRKISGIGGTASCIFKVIEEW